MTRTEVMFTGFGGQGIVLSGIILARAAVHDNKGAIQTQSYGPEARGGACRAETIIADDTVYYPFVEAADILVAMSQEALDKYLDRIKDGGRLIVDSSIVSQIPEKPGVKIDRVAASAIAAERLGRVIVANIVMLGALTRLTGIVSREALEKAVLESIPKGTEEVNLRALEAGFLESPAD